MEFSEEYDKIAPAFVKAQASFTMALKDTANPFFKSNYADLASYIKASSEGLQKNGLAVIQDPSVDIEAAVVTVHTTLLHESGQWMRPNSPLSVRAKDSSAQSMGSAMTYARRYSFGCFLGLASDDDDGNGANGHPPVKGAGKKVQPKKQPTVKTLMERFTEAEKMFMETHGVTTGQLFVAMGLKEDEEVSERGLKDLAEIYKGLNDKKYTVEEIFSETPA